MEIESACTPALRTTRVMAVSRVGPTGRNTTMDKLLLTPEEAARTLSIGRSKLYELLRAGALSSVRIGGSRRIPAAALQAYVAELSRSHRESAA